MEQSGLILTVVITYLMLMCALGIFLRRRVNSFSDFLVAGRNTGLLVVTGSFIGSHFGGGMTVGGAEYGVIKGFSGVWYGFAAGFSYLLFLTIARKVYTLKLITLPDVLERSYHTKRIRAVFALLAFAGVLGIIGGQILAGGAIFEVFGVSKTTGGIITFLIIVLYCSFSGLYGVMITDVIQVIIGGLGSIRARICGMSSRVIRILLYRSAVLQTYIVRFFQIKSLKLMVTYCLISLFPIAQNPRFRFWLQQYNNAL